MSKATPEFGHRTGYSYNAEPIAGRIGAAPDFARLADLSHLSMERGILLYGH
jgi:hypothetical protein